MKTKVKAKEKRSLDLFLHSQKKMLKTVCGLICLEMCREGSSEAKKYLDNEPIFFVILPPHITTAHFKSKNQDVIQVQTFCFKSNVKFNQKFKFTV